MYLINNREQKAISLCDTPEEASEAVLEMLKGGGRSLELQYVDHGPHPFGEQLELDVDEYKERKRSEYERYSRSD